MTVAMSRGTIVSAVVRVLHKSSPWISNYKLLHNPRNSLSSHPLSAHTASQARLRGNMNSASRGEYTTITLESGLLDSLTSAAAPRQMGVSKSVTLIQTLNSRALIMIMGHPQSKLMHRKRQMQAHTHTTLRHAS